MVTQVKVRGGDEDEDWNTHCMSFHLRQGGDGSESFYFLNGAEGSVLFRINSRERLWKFMSTTTGRERILELVGRPFGSARFCTDYQGQPAAMMMVPKIFLEPVSRRYDALLGLTMQHCRNIGIGVDHPVISSNSSIPKGYPFAVSFVRADDSKILTLE